MKEDIDDIKNFEIKKEENVEKINDTSIICEICKQQLPDKQAFRNHKKRHDQRSFSCFNCGKQFIGILLFHRHLLKYKLFNCEICGKDWPIKNRSRHTKSCIIKKEEIKSKKEDYECNNCEFNTTRKQYLERHIARKHTKISCLNCDEMFDNLKKLRNHVTFYHPKEGPKKEPVAKQCKWPNCSFQSKHHKNVLRHEKINCSKRPETSVSFIWF